MGMITTSFLWKKPLRRWTFLFGLFFFLELVASFFALFVIGAETDQGNIYRILFIHVPVAWCAFAWVFYGAFQGLLALLRKQNALAHDQASHASMELGALFSALILVTGSLWGKPTWGVWWDWDPRLTSSLVMFLVCCGYLVLRRFTPNAENRRSISAVLSLLCAINVPIVYSSVTIWRSVHQPQTFAQKTQNVSHDIALLLCVHMVLLSLLSFALYKMKRQSLTLEETLCEQREERG